MPFSLESDFWRTPLFWGGLFFVSFPLNYLVYGLNDYNDFKADKINDRKGSHIIGAKSSKVQLISTPKKGTYIIRAFIFYFTIVSGFKMLLLLLFMVGINVIITLNPSE